MTAIAVMASLTPECRALVARVILACSAVGLEMRPYSGTRDPVAQAALWRRSRSWATISAEVKSLRQARCEFLARCIEKAGPHSGRLVTHAIPGLSWHNFGQACDLVLVKDGVFDWDDAGAYVRFGMIVKACSGKWGGDFGDDDHLQTFNDEPLDHYGSIQDINAVQEGKWSSLLGA